MGYTEHCSFAVEHCVAVWTNGAQISNRVNIILLADIGKRLKVMGVDKRSSKIPIEVFEITTSY